MRAVVQRVSRCSVTSEGTPCGAIGPGFCVLLGVAEGDGPEQARWLADKVTGLRVFKDDEDRMNASLTDVGGALMVVSQFTLLGDCRKGRRPSFVKAARPEVAEELYELFVARCRELGVPVECGVFQTHMVVSLDNDGPVTLVIDTPGGES